MRGEIVRRCCLVEKPVSKSQILSDGDVEPSIIVRRPPIDQMVTVRHDANGRATIRIDLPPAGMAMLTKPEDGFPRPGR